MNQHTRPTSRQLAINTASITMLAVLPVAMLAGIVVVMLGPPPAGWAHAIDFHMFWRAARAFAAGRSPYPRPHEFVISGPNQSFFYPPSTAALLTPFAALSYRTASLLFVLLLALAICGSLWLFGVRDWRCYGAALLSPSAITAVSVGTITPLLLLGVAATWRWRNRVFLLGVIAGLTVVVKLILWPLLIWLWFTRRRASALSAIAAGILACMLSWWWLGFSGFNAYPGLLRHAERLEGKNGYGILWLLGGTSTSYLACAGVAAVVVAWFARRRDDASGLAIAVLASLVATPQLWLHYVLLLAAVAALLRPRLHVLWLLPSLLWITPHQAPGGSWWRVGVLFAVLGVAAAQTARSAASVNRPRTVRPAAAVIVVPPRL